VKRRLAAAEAAQETAKAEGAIERLRGDSTIIAGLEGALAGNIG